MAENQRARLAPVEADQGRRHKFEPTYRQPRDRRDDGRQPRSIKLIALSARR